MGYWNLNIKIPDDGTEQKSPAQVWLNERKFAPIFFGEERSAQLLSGNSAFEMKPLNEARSFIRLPECDPEAWLVTIDDGFIWIYQITGNIREDAFHFIRAARKGQKEEPIQPKFFEIKNLKTIKCEDAPYILAAMRSSQAFARGTFTRIDRPGDKYAGNIAALKVLLGQTKGLKINPLKCLSAVELETLVAKIFEANGAFVPAHRGGTLQGIDIFAHTSTDKLISGISYEPGSKLAIQVKSSITDRNTAVALKSHLSRPNHFLISPDAEIEAELTEFWNSGRYLTLRWMSEQITQHPTVNKWLKRSLNWLPQECWLAE